MTNLVTMQKVCHNSLMNLEALVVIKSLIKVLIPVDSREMVNPNVSEYLKKIYAFILKKSSDANADLAVREQGMIV